MQVVPRLPFAGVAGRVWLGLAAGLPLALAGGVVAQEGEQTFRSTVDVIAVDVQVVDGDGRPISGLGPDEFQVSIDGRRRRVVSASLTKYTTPPTSSRPAGRAIATNDWPATGAPGRTFVLAIDAGSFSPIESDLAVNAARRFVSQLSPDDAVGVFTLPHGPGLAPTADRAAVRRTLAGITGQLRALPSTYGLTVPEIIDITAQAARLRTISEPLSFSGVPSEDEVLAEAQLRECPGDSRSRRVCGDMILIEAQALSLHLEEQVLRALSGINAMLRLLREYPGRKTVVVLSAGMPASDRSGGRPNLGDEVQKLGEEAAHANAMIYAVHLDLEGNASASTAIRSPRNGSHSRMRTIQSKLLADFSRPSGGTLLRVNTGYGDAEVDRLLLETSSYYLLGVEPDARDRDGRPHRLQVKVGVRGATVRSRQWVVMAPPPGG